MLNSERRNQMQPVVTIGGRRYHIDQEDDPSIELTKLFKSLGYHVEISEDYYESLSRFCFRF